MAYGPAAQEKEPPLLYSGVRLPAEYVEKAAAFLRAADLFPEAGYLSCPLDAEGMESDTE